MNRFVKRDTRWQDWFLAIIGAWLIVAPWVIGIDQATGRAWSEWAAGGVLFFSALWAIAMPGLSWPEWINIVVGVWLFIAPWAVGYNNARWFGWNDWIAGAVTVLLAAWSLARLRGRHSLTDPYASHTGPLGSWEEPDPNPRRPVNP